jgi:hypothetical protein
VVTPSPSAGETASYGLSDSPLHSWDWSRGWSWVGARVKSKGAYTSSVGPGSFVVVVGASFVAGGAMCTCYSSAFSPGGRGTTCLGWYMRGVGYVLGAGGGLRGAESVHRALWWSCRMERPC